MQAHLKTAILLIACILLIMSIRGLFSLAWLSAHADAISASWFHFNVLESSEYQAWLANEQYPPTTNVLKILMEPMSTAGFACLVNIILSALLFLIALFLRTTRNQPVPPIVQSTIGAPHRSILNPIPLDASMP